MVRSERYMMYKTIFNELGFYRQPSKPEERIMDSWFDKYNMDIEVILSACSRAKNTSNPSISYINGIIEKWKKSDVKTLDDIKRLDDEYKMKLENKKTSSSNNQVYPKQVKTRFHNINQRTDKYTAEELEQLILQNKKNKFK